MSQVEDPLRSTQDAYPADLARFVRERWDEDRVGTLPDQDTLETLISACYQAGLLHEEERAVTFRVILCDPDLLSPREGPSGRSGLYGRGHRAFAARDQRVGTEGLDLIPLEFGLL